MRNSASPLIKPVLLAVVTAAPRLRGAVALRAGVSALAVLAALSTVPAMANPAGGVVVGGSAVIAGGGSTVTINQSSQRAAINWQSFSVGSGETTKFVQPNSSAVTFNRVVGSDPSQILGHVSANGQIILANPNGVVFGKGAVVDAAGLVATTHDADPNAFMQGGSLRFNQKPGANPNASVVNEGTVNIQGAGVAAFVAPSVRNSGTINAVAGTVDLAAGKGFAIDLYGDKLVSFAPGDAIANTITDTSGVPVKALVNQEGAINAHSVNLTATTARDVVNAAVRVTGTIAATTVSKVGGTIHLGGGSGSVQVENATLTATNTQGSGGSIHILGDSVNLTNSSIDASGQTGGGTIRIGGGRQGGEGLQASATTNIDRNTTIKANATSKGNGGSVVVWSNGDSHISGRLEAKGGAISGNGGSIETSGKHSLTMTGSVDATAAHGSVGNWLVDPTNITIYNRTQAGTDNTNTFTTSYLETQSVSANITLSATNNITLDMTADTLTLTSGRTITLTAGNTITSASAGSIIAAGGGAINLTATSGDINFGNAINLTSSNGAITLRAAGNIVESAGGNTTTSGGAIVFNADRDGNSSGAIALTGSSLTTGGGAVSLVGGTSGTGAAYGSSATYFRGISLVNATIDATGASGGIVTITGTGWSGGTASGSPGTMSSGVVLDGSQVKTGGTAAMTVVGIGAGTGAGGGMGVYLTNTSNFITYNGALSVTGTGAGGSSATLMHGVFLNGVGNNRIQSSLGGNVTITGTGASVGATNYGVSVTTGTSASKGLISTNGNLTVTGIGTAASSYGISDTGTAGNFMSSGTGSVTIIADTVNLAVAPSITAVSGDITIRPYTAGTTVGIGSGAGTLSITDTALAAISTTSGTLWLGGYGLTGLETGYWNSAGTMTINTANSFANNVNFLSAAAINSAAAGGFTLTGAASTIFSAGTDINFAHDYDITTATGGVTLRANQNIIYSASGDITTSGGAIILNADRDGNSSGAISLGSGTVVASGGGNISLVGGATASGNTYGMSSTYAQGIALTSATIDASGVSGTGGNIVMNGIGWAASTATASGPSLSSGILLNGATVQTNNSGSITTNGTGAGTGVGYGYGVYVYNTSTILGVNGAITVTGIGGSGTSSTNNADGVSISGTGTNKIQSTGSGNIVVNGTGGSPGVGGNGIVLNTGGTTYGILSATGNVTLTGIANGSYTGIVNNSGGANTIGGNSATGTITLIADSLGLSPILKTTGDVIIRPYTASTTVGVGTSSTGTLKISDAMLNNITAGTLWLGGYGIFTTDTGYINNAGAVTVNTAATLANNTVIMSPVTITTSSAIAMAAGKNLTLMADDLILGGNISGTGTLTLEPSSISRPTCVNYASGTCSGSVMALSTTEVGYLVDGWSQINIGRTDGTATNSYGATTWLDPVTFRNQSRMEVRGTLTGTGNASFTFTGTSGWVDDYSNITTAGGTIDMSGVNRVYNGAAITLTTAGGVAAFSQIQDNTGFNLTVNTTSGNITLSNKIYQFGSTSGNTVTLNAGTGNVSFGSTVDTISNVSATGTAITFGGAWGATNNLGNVTLTAVNSLTLPAITATAGSTVAATVTGAGNSITASTIDTGAGGNITLTSDDLTLGGNLSGTGTVTLQPNSASRITYINYGSADGTNWNLSTTEIGRLTDGWGTINLGRTDSTVAFYAGAATWTDPVHFRNNSPSTMVFSGNITGTDNASLSFDANSNNIYFIPGVGSSLTVQTNNQNITLNGNLRQAGTAALALTTVFNGGTGTINFNGSIQNGSSSYAYNLNATANTITFNGNIGGTSYPLGTVTLNTVNNITLPSSVYASTFTATASGAGSKITTGTITTGTGGNIILTADDLAIGGNLSGTGIVTLKPYSATRVINIATGANDGTDFNLGATEINYLVSGWTGIVIGANTHNGGINDPNVTYNAPVTLLENNGDINIADTITMGANSFTAQTTGTGNINFNNGTITTSATGVAVTLISGGAITATGTNAIISSAGTVSATSVGNMSLAPIVATGVTATATGASSTITTSTIAVGTGGNITLTANDLIIGGALSGTGTVALKPYTSTQATCINYSSGYCTGSYLSLSTAEIANLTDGWSAIGIGDANNTGNFEIGATTWTDPVTFYNNYRMETQGNVTGTGNASFTFGTTAATSGWFNPLAKTITTAGGNVTVNRSLMYNGGGISTINSNGGNVSFSSLVTEANGGLAVNSSNGNITINGAISKNTVGALATTFNAGTGTVAFGNTVNTDGDVTATGNAITFNGAWGATNNLGNVTLTAVNSITLPAITATAGSTVAATVSGAGNKITTGTITTGTGGNITLASDDITIGGNLSGTGTITLLQNATNRVVNINRNSDNGTSYYLDSAEIAYLVDGWSNINLGRSDSTAYTYVGASTWTDPVTFRGGTMSVYADANITGTGNASFSFLNSWGLNFRNNSVITTAGQTVTVSSGLGIESGGTIATNGGAISVGGGIQLRNGNVSPFTITTLGGNITLSGAITEPFVSSVGKIFTANAGSGTVSFGSTVNAGADMAATGNAITFNGAWGGTTGLGNVTLTSVNSLTLPAITTAAGKTVSATVTGAGNSITAGTITTGTGGNITLTADDLVLGGALSGTGNVTLKPYASNREVYINYGTADGTNLNLSTTELGYLTDGWGAIYLGAPTGNSAWVRIGSSAFTDDVYFGNAAEQIYGALTSTNKLSFTGGYRLVIGGSGYISTTGADVNLINFQLYNTSNATSINTSGGKITATGLFEYSSNINSTLNSGNGDISIGGNVIESNGTHSAYTIILNAGTGALAFGGTVNGTEGITATANGITFNGAWGGSTALGNVTLTSVNSMTLPSITAQAGKTVTATVTGAGNSITTGAISTGTGGNITLTADDLTLNGALSGTGTVMLRPNADSRAVYVNYGSADGTNFNLSTAEIANLTDGWSGITIGRTTSTDNYNIGASTWTDPVTFTKASGTNTISGALTGTGNASFNFASSGLPLNLINSNITTAGGDVTIVGNKYYSDAIITTNGGAVNLSSNGLYTNASTGNLTINSSGGAISMPRINGNTSDSGKTISLNAGSGAVTFAGTVDGGENFSVNGVSLGFASAWGGTTGLGNVTLTSVNSLTLPAITTAAGKTVSATVTGAGNSITAGAIATGTAGNITLAADDLTIGGALSGTGDLRLQPNSITRYVNVAYGTADGTNLNLSTAEIANLTDGWSNIYIGRTDLNGNMFIGASAWSDPITFQDVYTQYVRGTITGSGNASFAFSGGRTKLDGGNIVTAGQNVTIAGLITGVAGSVTTNGGAFSVSSTMEVNDNLTVSTSGGGITFGGAWTNYSGSTAGKAISLNAGTGTVAFASTVNTDSDITSTGNGITFNGIWGGTTPLGNITLTSVNSITLPAITTAAGKTVSATVTGAGNSITAGAIATGTGGNITLTSDDVTLGGALSGTGTVTLRPYAATQNVCINYSSGSCSSAHFDISTAELANLTDGWSHISIGQSSALSSYLYLGVTTWSDPVSFIGFAQRYVNGNLTGTDNASVTFTGPSGTWLNGSTITTNSQNFVNTGNLVFANGVINTNGGNVTQSASISLAFSSGSLNINTAGGAISGTTVTSSGSDVGKSVTLNAGSGAISFSGTVDGTADYTLNGSNITLSGVWGSTTAVGNITLTAVNSITLPAITTAAGKTVSATVTGAGNSITAGAIATGTAGNITLAADDVVLGANLSGTGTLTLKPVTLSRAINVNNGAGGFNLSTAELAYFADGWGSIVVGNASDTGTLTLGSANWVDPVSFLTSGTGSVVVSGAQTGTDNASFTFTGPTILSNNLTTANQAVTFNGAVTLGGNSVVNAGTGTITSASTINGAYNLTGTANTISLNGVIGGTTALGAVSLTSANAMTLPSITAASILARTTGTSSDLTIAAGKVLTASGSGTAITLASGRNFINNGGSGALVASSGRWLVWSADPSADTRGGLSYGFKQYNATYGVTAVAQATGNGFLYAVAPVLTGSLTGTVSKVYDGNTTATLTNANYNFSGAIDGDMIAATGGLTGTYDDKNVGSGKTVSVSGIAVGANNGAATVYGYQVNNTASGAIGAVTPKGLVVTADDKSKVYGASDPALTYSYTGLVGGDASASFSGAVSRASDENVNTYAIGQNNLAATGNYAIATFNNGTFSITPAALTITADDKTKTYGAALPTLTASYSGLVNGDNSSVVSGLTLATGATATSNVGDYAITGSGASASNYTISYVSGNLHINPAGLTITADDKTKTYGAALPTLTASYSGLVNGDNSSVVSGLALATTGTASSNVGDYAISGSGASAGNYTISYVNGNLHINPAGLTITADDKTKTYGAALPTLTASYSGLVNGDNSSVVSGLTLATGATATSNVGDYAIAGSGASASNYTISYVNGNLHINPAGLTITADDKTKTYGAALPTLTASYSGLVNGDNSSVVSGLALATGATATSNVGDYAISGSGASAGNYTISYVNGNLHINPAGLTITADDKTKTYGAALPTLTASYSGLVNGDNSSVVSGLALATTGTASSNVGDYAISGSGASAGNYTISYVNGNLHINPAGLTITADDKTKTYGAALPSLTASYSGLVNGDNSTVVSGLILATTGTATSNVGDYAISGSGASAGNYTISYVNGNLHINSAALTITADDKTKTYGAALPTLTASYSGLVNGDNSTVVSGLILATTGTATSNVGDYAISGSGASAGNYTISYVNGNLHINPASLTITADDKTKTYGAALPTLTASYSGLVNGDNSSVVSGLTLATGATATSNVGDYAISGSGASAGNYTISYVNGNLHINSAALTIMADDKTKTYGAALPTLTASYSGLVNGDNSSVVSGLSLATAGTSASNVGDYAISGSGASAGNYTISYVNGNLHINPAGLTITADDKTKTYGAALPTLTASYSGLVNGDNSTVVSGLSLATAGTSASNVGDYAITGSGASASNYTISYVSGNLHINPAGLTITADDKTKTYGAALPTLTASYSGLVNGDNSSVVSGLALATGATATSNVGDYAISGSGASAGNYTISYVNGNLHINPAGLTITADDKTKTYGAALPTLTASYSGLVNGDNSSVVSGLTLATGATAASNVGDYAITGSGASASNYTISYVSGNLHINPAGLTITADDKTKTYGAALPTLTASYSGLVNGDNSSVVSGLALATTGTASSNVGDYAISGSGASAGNYTISYVNGNLHINPAGLTITADDKTKTYGAALPSLTASYSGLVNGDNSTVVSGLTLATGATAASNVGDYAISGSGASAGNYTISYVNGNLHINSAALTITADDKTKTYGAALPTLTASYSGLVNGDNSSVVSGLALATTGTASSNVGDYAISGSGASAGNYTISYVNGNLHINPAGLTITADDKTKTYGAALPTLTASYSGLVNGDNSSVVSGLTLATGATATSNVGDYAISGSGASAGNYTISYVNGNLHINPASLTITADDKTKTYGAALPTLTASYSGLVNGDNSSVVSGLALATTGTASSNVGDYAIFGSGASAGNYTISYVNGNLHINPAGLTITADDKTKTYGAALPTLTASYSGLVNGDNSTVVSGLILATTGTASSNVGDYAISGSGASAGNYTISYVNGNLHINPAGLTITADDKTKTYGDANPTLTASYSGLTNGDTASSITGLTLNTSTTQSSNVGDYAIAASGASNGNYTISYVDGTLHIDQRVLTVSLTGSVSKIYDGNTTATLASGNYSLGNIYNGDAVTIGNTSGTYDDKNAATGKTVTVNSLALNGVNAGNYSLNGVTAVSGAIGTITAKTITVVGSFAASDKTYDGSRIAAITSNALTLSGVVAGDSANVSLSGPIVLFDTKDAGTSKTVSISTASLSGSESGNYILSLSGSPTTIASISAKTITVTGSFAAGDKIYDGTRTAAITSNALTLSGVVAGDAANVSLGGPTAMFDTKNAGSGKVVSIDSASLSGSEANNYVLSLSSSPTTTANISAKTITVTGSFAAGDKTYDGTRTASITSNGLTLSGVVAADASNVSLSGSTALFDIKDAGTGKTVSINTASLSGSESSNYILSLSGSPTTTATISAKTITVTGSFTASGKTYDSTRGATFASNALTLNGVEGSDLGTVTLSGLSALFSTKDVGDRTVSLDAASLSGSGSSNYTLSLSGAPTTHAIISTKTLTVGGSFTASDKIYDGTTGAAIATSNLNLTGIELADLGNVTLLQAAMFDTPSIGSHKTVSLNGSSLGGSEFNNYALDLSGAPIAYAAITGGYTPSPVPDLSIADAVQRLMPVITYVTPLPVATSSSMLPIMVKPDVRLSCQQSVSLSTDSNGAGISISCSTQQ